jgi:DNA-binding PadR family transcriptional regulator
MPAIHLTPNQIAVLVAIRNTEPEAYGNSILAEMNRNIKPNWITRLLPSLKILQRKSFGSLYIHLDRLEQAGLLTSEWSKETFPERGNLRRRYYHLTPTALDAIKQP